MAEALTQPSATQQPSLLDKLLTFGQAAIQLRRQDQVSKIQVERARAGQPLLPVEQLVPPMRAEVGLDRGTTNTMRTALLVAGGLGAAFLLTRMMKR